MAGRAEGTVRDVAGHASGVDRRPTPKASPVLQSEEAEGIGLIEVLEKIGQAKGTMCRASSEYLNNPNIRICSFAHACIHVYEAKGY